MMLRPYDKQLLAKQALVTVIKDIPFQSLSSSSSSNHLTWSPDSVIQLLRSISRFCFPSHRSIGSQTTNIFRHRSFPLSNQTYNPYLTNLALRKSHQFLHWIHSHFNFIHTQSTSLEMAILITKSKHTNALWTFLKQISSSNTNNVSSNNLVTVATVTCLIKLLGEQGLGKEALLLFYRMRQFGCKPDVQAYNALINAMCSVGNFTKARHLLQQMELPGFHSPPDVFTYTILISFYCRYGVKISGCRKAVRRRLYEANRLFRVMVFKGIVPDVVTYNALIDGCCKTYRVGRALELFEDMKKRGCVPNRVTYDSFIRYYSAVNEIDKAVEFLRDMQRLNRDGGNEMVGGCSSYTPIIHALCEVGRVVDAWNFLVELVDRRSVPREYTYKLVCDGLRLKGEDGLLSGEVHRRIKYGILERYKRTMKAKPVMTRKGYPELEDLFDQKE
ncbi:pentatricopeptide repeat-containing protein [Trifolium repens]|nr:pentatricopeptide repeat-containing protein [Trifolium repens]